MMTTSVSDFESKVEMVPECGCWIWMGATRDGRYGNITVHSREKRTCGPSPQRDVRAHRFSWKLYNGAIPKGMKVLHRCDTPCCVNPRHLFIGSHQDNMTDKARKGRNRNNRKLTEEQVLQIKQDGRLQREIAKDYGICRQCVSMIKLRQSWKHL